MARRVRILRPRASLEIGEQAVEQVAVQGVDVIGAILEDAVPVGAGTEINRRESLRGGGRSDHGGVAGASASVLR